MAKLIEVTVRNNLRLNQIAGAFPRTAARALNRVAKVTQTMMSRRIREVFTVKASGLKSVKGKPAMYVKQATTQQLAAAVVLTGRHIPLAEFQFRWTRSAKGATIIYAHGRRMMIPHSFVPILSSGHRGVFVRYGRKVESSRSGSRQAEGNMYLRQKIRELSGPSPAQMYQDREVSRVVEADTLKQLETEIDTALRDISRGFANA
jgi:hypothetical protein